MVQLVPHCWAWQSTIVLEMQLVVLDSLYGEWLPLGIISYLSGGGLVRLPIPCWKRLTLWSWMAPGAGGETSVGLFCPEHTTRLFWASVF